MNKLATLMKETRCKKEPDGDFIASIVPIPNEENFKDLKLQVTLTVTYKTAGVQDTAICQPIDLTETLNNMAGRLLNLAKQENFKKEEAAKEQAATTEGAESQPKSKAPAPASSPRKAKPKKQAK